MNSYVFTIAALMLIVGVFATALVLLSRELQYVRLLADYLGYAGGDRQARADKAAGKAAGKPPASLVTERIRDEVDGVLAAAEHGLRPITRGRR